MSVYTSSKNLGIPTKNRRGSQIFGRSTSPNGIFQTCWHLRTCLSGLQTVRKLKRRLSSNCQSTADWHPESYEFTNLRRFICGMRVRMPHPGSVNPIAKRSRISSTGPHGFALRSGATRGRRPHHEPTGCASAQHFGRFVGSRALRAPQETANRLVAFFAFLAKQRK